MNNSKLLRALREWLIRFLTPLPKPQPAILTQTGKVVITVLNYKLTLPAATATDVVKWEQETTLNGAAPVVAEAKDGDMQPYTQGDTVSVRWREVDDAGNFSDWSDPLTFTAADTLAPTKPGVAGLELVSED